jgi:3-hydroxyacyl-CoA dehydrogenase
MISIRRVAVLGAGTMGSRIAAHFANAGIPALLLDIVVPGVADRNAAAKKGIETAWKGRPGGFFTDALPALVTPGNFEDDLAKLADCDWIIEAVTEKLDVKRALWTRVAEVRRPGSIVSTNTSGIPLALIAEGFSDDFRANFLGTHFFNPPRYLHLCEIIPGPATAPALLQEVGDFIDRRLGKGVVLCKDTPNFIGNRIGSMWGSTAFKYAIEDDFTVEELDALTGSLIGLPNSASCRLIDIVGVDIWYHVGANLYDLVPTDPWRDRFQPHPVMEELMKRNWLGDKTGQGFYKRVGPAKEIHALNWKTYEYAPAAKPKFASVEQAKLIEDLPARLRALVASNDKAGNFLWKLFRDVLLYSAERIPEISDRIVEIDRAMRWGYAHTYGPFELWDALGFTETARRMEADGLALPASITTMLSHGAKSFYRSADDSRQPRTDFFDLGMGHYKRLEERPGVVSLPETKRAGNVVKKNSGCSLIDLGDGVLNVEFHSKMNSLGEDQMSMVQSAYDECKKGFQAVVIGNQGELFSAGANLMMVLMLAQDEEFDELDIAINRFQQSIMSIKYAPVPVVVAAHSKALGGGCEMILHGPRVQVSAELYTGLVEVGVGLIPGGGGCKEMILRHGNPKTVFETIGYAKVSTSAEEARKLGFLDAGAGISMNGERLIGDAKVAALALAQTYKPSTPRDDVKVAGLGGLALLKQGVWLAHQGGYITDYDQVIGEKLAHVLCGGRLSGEQLVSEQYLLDLEREAFLSLCGDARTQARMAHMLKTGKPLRN